MSPSIVPLIVGLLIVHTLVVSVTAAPAETGSTVFESGSGQRQTRATCDLASLQIGGIAINHAMCAAHCLVMGRGFRGGSCVNGVCHCRK